MDAEASCGRVVRDRLRLAGSGLRTRGARPGHHVIRDRAVRQLTMGLSDLRERLPSGRRSLVARLVTTFLVLSVVMLAIVGVVSYLQARSALEDAAFARLETAADQKADSLDRWIDEQRRNVVFTAGLLGGYTGELGVVGGPARGLLATTSPWRTPECAAGGRRHPPATPSRRPPTRRSSSSSISTAGSSRRRRPSTSAFRRRRRRIERAHPGRSSDRRRPSSSPGSRRSRSERRSSTATVSASASSQRSSTSSASTASSCSGPAWATPARRTSSEQTAATCTPRS